MKLKINGKKVRFKFKKEDDRSVLVIVDEEGKRVFAGSVLSIYKNGTCRLHRCVNDEYGLKLERDGRIKVVQE